MPDVAPDVPILVPLDGSPAAESVLPYAARLAGPAGRVLLVHVVPEPRPLRDVLGNVVMPADDLLVLTRDAAMADLERARTRLRALAPQLRVDHEVGLGEAALEIIRAAERHQPWLVIAATRGQGFVADDLLGSVADRLTRAMPAPLLLIRPNGSTPAAIRRLVVALDGSNVAHAALDVAQTIALRHDFPIHLVSVVDDKLAGALPLERGDWDDDRLAGELLADARRDAQRTVEHAGAMLLRRGIGASWETPTGAAAAVLAGLCGPEDLLVVSSHGHGRAQRWGLGSVASRLLQIGRAPTLLVRTMPAAPRNPAARTGLATAPLPATGSAAEQ